MFGRVDHEAVFAPKQHSSTSGVKSAVAALSTLNPKGSLMTEHRVRENSEKSRFELEVDGVTAFAEYRRQGDRVVLAHTVVPEQLSGKGIGKQLARGTFEILRSTDRKVVTECAFMAAYVAKHPDLAALVES